MKREIKFRGKCISSKKWWVGSLIIHISGCCEIMPMDVNMETEDVYPETVGQYIGLKDKNGKEIFEGDIVKMFSGAIHEIYYSELQAYYTLKGIKPLSEVYESFEVIGTIYDNPELLNT